MPCRTISPPSVCTFISWNESYLSGCVPNRECLQFRFDRLPNIRRSGSALETANSRLNTIPIKPSTVLVLSRHSGANPTSGTGPAVALRFRDTKRVKGSGGLSACVQSKAEGFSLVRVRRPPLHRVNDPFSVPPYLTLFRLPCSRSDNRTTAAGPTSLTLAQSGLLCVETEGPVV